MKKTSVMIVGLAMVTALAGCQSSPNRAGEGAVIGGALGAGLGAIIGHQSGETGEGAALGAGAGALAGALIGSQQQKQPQSGQPQQQVQANNPNQMSAAQIVELTRQGVHEDVIVDRIKMSGSRFNLAQSDIDYLRSQGVTQKVVNAMQGW
jgi:uncharacterized protein YcfJ